MKRLKRIMQRKRVTSKTDQDRNIAESILEKGSKEAAVSANDICDIKPSEMLEKICHNLETSSNYFGKSQQKEWAALLVEFRNQPHNRFQYSHISQWIFAKIKESDFVNGKEVRSGTIGTILTNLDKMKEYIQSPDIATSNPDIQKYFFKFYDHVNLAVQQGELFVNASSVLNTQIESKVKQELAEKTSELTSQLVGLIGIFTALSFIVFGGITALESLVNNLSAVEDSIIPVIILAIAWAFCIMNLLYSFMYFVLKIVKSNFTNANEPQKNIVQKYPTVWLTNYILFIAFMISGAIWYAERNEIGNDLYHFLVVEHSTQTFVGGLAIIACIILLIGSVLLYLYINRKDY